MNSRGPKSGYRRTIPLRRDLRKFATPAETMFWSMVRNQQCLGLKFRRQHGIGNYIVDFYCPDKELIIEIDGDTHASEDDVLRDRLRTAYLNNLGFKVVRYTNSEVLNNLEGVYNDLVQRLT